MNFIKAGASFSNETEKYNQSTISTFVSENSTGLPFYLSHIPFSDFSLRDVLPLSA